MLSVYKYVTEKKEFRAIFQKLFHRIGSQNCSELSAAYSVGSAAAAASALESLLRARPDLLPEGHSAEALAGCVVGFFARQERV